MTIKTQRATQWRNMYLVDGSGICICCGQRTSCRISEESGDICYHCWMNKKRCQCGNGEPIIREANTCRNCYTGADSDKQMSVMDFMHRESSISRCGELGSSKGDHITLREIRSVKMHVWSTYKGINFGKRSSDGFR